MATASTKKPTTSASISESATVATSNAVATSTAKTGVNRATATGIGIGLGVAFAVILLAGLVYSLRRRSKTPLESPRSPENQLYIDGKKELDGEASGKGHSRAHELMNESWPAEMAGERERVELAGRSEEVELGVGDHESQDASG